MSDNFSILLRRAQRQDFKALGRLLSFVETEGAKAFKSLLVNNKNKFCLRIGITGSPGAGKSTLINGLISEFRKQNLTVGVLAVDPSSPFSHGAILGDRIRYHDHFNDPHVFIRSIGSRGALGGLSGPAHLMARVFDVAGFDLLIIETVGVGQTELEIMNVADVVSVIVVPEFGDSIQTLKAGILEIADVLVVNKSDRPGADALAKELKAWATKDKVEVLNTVATEKTGVMEFASLLLKYHDPKLIKKKRGQVSRLQGEAISLLRMQLEKKAQPILKKIKKEADLLKILKS